MIMMPDVPRVIVEADSIGEFVVREVETPDGPRRYKLFIPKGYDKAKPAPLLVVLHGCTQDPNDIAKGTRFNEIAGGKGFLVAYPEQPQKYNGLKCWNWFEATHQVRDKGEPALIASITRRVMSDYVVNPKKVYIAGLSAGGAMAVITAYAYPELFAAAGIHSGIAYGSVTSIANALTAMHSGASDPASLGLAVVKGFGSARHFPAIVFQGKADKSVNWVNASQIVSQLLQSYPPRKGSAVETGPKWTAGEAAGYHFTKTTYGEETSIIEEWIVDELGHAWSGGSKDGTYTDASGPDASEEMVRFFLEHPRG